MQTIKNTPEKPLIAVSANLTGDCASVGDHYSEAIIRAGGVPLIVPCTTDPDVLAAVAAQADGLLLTGGADIDARYFGEENLSALTKVDPRRDSYEMALWRACSRLSMPVFGVCRGVQLLNAVYGGTLFQDLPTQYDGELLPHSVLDGARERACHEVTIPDGSRLRDILGCETVGVNSRHHQAIKRPAEGFRVAATAPDGVIEAIETVSGGDIWGVQWHPENMAVGGDNAVIQRLFDHFVSQCGRCRMARALHRAAPIVDSHCDTPMLFTQGDIDFGAWSDTAKVDLPKMLAGGVDCVFEVAYVPHNSPNPYALTVALLTEMAQKAAACGVAVARSVDEILRCKAEGEKCVALGIENGEALEERAERLDEFAARGVQYMTLCHNGDNALCDSAVRSDHTHGGLSELGREIVARMNRLGITVDVSHAADAALADALACSRQPIVATHSGARAVCDHPRNLTDEHIRAIAACGGVVQVCLYADFLRKGGDASIADIVRHIDHIASLVGADHVGIGSDFDGGGGIPGCNHAGELINVTKALLAAGYSVADTAGIMGGNFLRTLAANQAEARTVSTNTI